MSRPLQLCNASAREPSVSSQQAGTRTPLHRPWRPPGSCRFRWPAARPGLGGTGRAPRDQLPGLCRRGGDRRVVAEVSRIRGGGIAGRNVGRAVEDVLFLGPAGIVHPQRVADRHEDVGPDDCGGRAGCMADDGLGVRPVQPHGVVLECGAVGRAEGRRRAPRNESHGLGAAGAAGGPDEVVAVSVAVGGAAAPAPYFGKDVVVHRHVVVDSVPVAVEDLEGAAVVAEIVGQRGGTVRCCQRTRCRCR